MPNLLIIFATALLFAISATPLARRLALRRGWLDIPGAHKAHARPIPLLGGAAIYGAFLLALALFTDRFYIAQTVSIVVGASWVSLLGFWDDRAGMRALVKLLGQVFGALILVGSGVTVGMFQQPALDIALTIVWIVGITNALNLLDNMDGLAGGVAAMAAVFFLLIAALNGQVLVASLSAALFGAALGFLLYNFNPAQIFMGDAGSLFLGFVLAAIGIKLRFPTHPVVETWFIPILVLGLPIFDTLLVMISRTRRGVNPLTHPGLDHLSHRLMARGLTKRETVLTCYLIAGALGVLALFCAQASLIENYAVLAFALMAMGWGIWKLEFQEPANGSAS